jgi:hypothetical protein
VNGGKILKETTHDMMTYPITIPSEDGRNPNQTSRRKFVNIPSKQPILFDPMWHERLCEMGTKSSKAYQILLILAQAKYGGTMRSEAVREQRETYNDARKCDVLVAYYYGFIFHSSAISIDLHLQTRIVRNLPGLSKDKKFKRRWKGTDIWTRRAVNPLKRTSTLKEIMRHDLRIRLEKN